MSSNLTPFLLQFVDNELECPPAHPAHAEWLTLAAEAASKADAERAAAVGQRAGPASTAFAGHPPGRLSGV